MKRNTNIVWEDPDGENLGKYEEIIKDLKKFPKCWGRILIYKTRAAANSARYILMKKFPFLEMTTRTGDGGKGLLYARYIPQLKAAKKGPKKGRKG